MESLVAEYIKFIQTTFAVADENHILEHLERLTEKYFAGFMGLCLFFLSIFALGRVFSKYQTKKTKYYYQPTSEKFARLFKSTKLNDITYQPWTYAFNGHVQAAVYPLLEQIYKFIRKFDIYKEFFVLSDSSTIAIEWIPCKDTNSKEELTLEQIYKRTNPLIVIIPGLTGDSTNLYMTSVFLEAHKNKYDVVVINYKGNAGAQVTGPHIYHGACHDDLQEALEYVKEVRPDSIMMGVGISLGAGVLANYIAKTKEECLLKAGVCIGCPYNLFEMMDHISSLFYGAYNFALGTLGRILITNHLRQVDAINAKHNPDKVIGNDVYSIYTLHSFVERVVVKLENFSSVEHYYQEASCSHRLKDVKIPLFFLSALDDPIVGPKAIPIDKCHENILIGVTKTGGHLGYLEGLVFPHKQWHPEPTFEFLNHFIREEEKVETPRINLK